MKTKKFEVVFEVTAEITIPKDILQVFKGHDAEVAKTLAEQSLQDSMQFYDLVEAGGAMETYWNHVSTRKVTDK